MRSRLATTLITISLAAVACTGSVGELGHTSTSLPGTDRSTVSSTDSTQPASGPSRTPDTPGGGRDLDILSGRAAHTATTLLDGTLMVAGGCVVDGCASATADTFLVAADGTSVVHGPAMTTVRDSHTATLVADGRVVLAGGFAGEGERPLASIDVFDPLTGSMAAGPAMALGRGGHVAAAAGDGRVLITGGWIGPRSYTATTEIYDPVTGTITAGPELPVAADALDAVTLSDGRVLVTGGQVEPGVATAAAAVFDPATLTWTVVGHMHTPRLKHMSVLLPDGTALVIGGSTDDRTLLATTEIFDPTIGGFTPGPDLVEPRYKMQGGAVVVHGHLVIAGGGRTVEAIDLHTGVSKIIDTFAVRGSFATINALGSGGLLVIGGYDDRINLRREILVIALENV